MWSLPNIVSMNTTAASKKGKLAIKKALKETTECHCTNWGSNPCNGEIHTYKWYDVFSDDPKGVLGLCETHEESYGSTPEGYFCCDCCGKTFIENYTWELYYTHTEDGEQYCLNCYFDKEIENKNNWVDKSFLKLNNEQIFNKIKQAKHLIPNSGTHWKKSLTFVDNCEFNFSNGQQISGEDIRNVVKKALLRHKKAVLIRDSAYQFAVSIGVYVEK